jgi:nucleotide-binding universal stress UspA family protein
MTFDKTVAVGVDGSVASLAAARFAAGLAERRATSLTLVYGYVDPLGYGALAPMASPVPLSDPRMDGDAILDEATKSIGAEFPGLQLSTMLVGASGVGALIDESHNADVVVVGHRGLGGFAELLLGSVGAQVCEYAHCPVVVHRPTEGVAADAPVVVGVDGAPGGDTVVGFAFEEAAGRGAALEAVHVYLPVEEGSAARAEGVLNAALAPWQARYPNVSVHRDARRVDLDNPAFRWHTGPTGSAEAVFVEKSRDSRLIVVGARGRGGFTGLLLGSVSQALVHHAHCSVAVVR